ncbi:MAG TPA: hypothetical protein VKE27_00535 [Candidatus Dormibacteraeota bacterium]|nr:hypothetical protein [Candidatus Dormibacteraeota bacterium]
MPNRKVLKRLFPIGVVGAVITLAALLPAGPIAAVLATYGSAYSLGGKATQGPDAAAATASEDVFVVGTDSAVWHAGFNGTTMTSGWTPGGGIATSDVGAVGVGGGVARVFVRGTNDQAWETTWNGSAFSTWTPLGGLLRTAVDPAFEAGSPGKVDLVTVGTDGGAWFRQSLDGGATWPTGWTPLGGVLTADPGIVSWAPGRVDIVGRGTDNGVWIRSSSTSGGTFNNWAPLGGIATSGPDAASCRSGSLDIFVRGTDNGEWHLGFNGTWSGWKPEGNAWSSDVGAVCRPGGAGIIDYFGVGTDQAVWHQAAGAS